MIGWDEFTSESSSECIVFVRTCLAFYPLPSRKCIFERCIKFKVVFASMRESASCSQGDLSRKKLYLQLSVMIFLWFHCFFPITFESSFGDHVSRGLSAWRAESIFDMCFRQHVKMKKSSCMFKLYNQNKKRCPFSSPSFLFSL